MRIRLLASEEIYAQLQRVKQLFSKISCVEHIAAFHLGSFEFSYLRDFDTFRDLLRFGSVFLIILCMV